MTNETGSMSLTSMIKNSALQSHFMTNIFTKKGFYYLVYLYYIYSVCSISHWLKAMTLLYCKINFFPNFTTAFKMDISQCNYCNTKDNVFVLCG